METNEIIELISKNALKAKIEQARTGNANILNTIRGEVFVAKQKLVVLRKWFAMLWDIKLTTDELNIIKKIIVKPKSTQNDIVFQILVNQRDLNELQLEEWFSYITQDEKPRISFDLIKSGLLKNDSFQIKIFKELLLNKEYLSILINEVDISLNLGNREIWEKYFDILVNIINKNNDLSKKIIFYWKKTFYLNDFAKLKKVYSPALYEETKLEHYLPQIVVDTFLF